MDNLCPKVYAIVVTYNGEKWINKCLESLHNSIIPIHIIVVDNCSTDKTIQIIKNNYPEIELILSKKNLGFGKGNNVGLKRALEEKADYVFLLNQDAWIESNSIQTLVNIAQVNPNFEILSPLHLNGEGSALETKCNEYINVYDCPRLISDKFLNKELMDVYRIRFINAAAWLISRKCLDTVGGFDPLFPHYGEDEDYIERAKLKGFFIGISPLVHIYHDSEFNWENIKNNPDRQLVFNFLCLKNLSASFKSNLLIFLKTRIDLLSSLLLYRKFDEFIYHFKILNRTLAYLPEIKKARNLSKIKNAFLNNE